MGRLLLTVALLCIWSSVTIANAAPQTTAELEALILTPQELGEGFAIVLDEPDERAPSFFRVMDRRSRSVAAVGITLLSDPVATPRESVAVLVRPFLVEYTAGMPFAPTGFPGGAFAIPLSGGEGGPATSGIVLAWREADVLALMTVLVEWASESTDATVATEIEGWIGRQRDKLAGALGQQTVAVGQMGPVGRPVAPPAQVPAQAPAKPVGR
ncbi:MAG: hypothetical protein AB7R89_30145 [Dehalococcoidia bacterium]